MQGSQHPNRPHLHRRRFYLPREQPLLPHQQVEAPSQISHEIAPKQQDSLREGTRQEKPYSTLRTREEQGGRFDAERSSQVCSEGLQTVPLQLHGGLGQKVISGLSLPPQEGTLGGANQALPPCRLGHLLAHRLFLSRQGGYHEPLPLGPQRQRLLVPHLQELPVQPGKHQPETGDKPLKADRIIRSLMALAEGDSGQRLRREQDCACLLPTADCPASQVA